MASDRISNSWRQSQSLTRLAAFQKILELTQPKQDSQEIWLKLGHDLFLVGDYDVSGRFSVWETRGKGKTRIRTRNRQDCWQFVSQWCKNNDGGVFFVPTQPIGYPLKDCIHFSDDVAAELDSGTSEEQWRNIEKFWEISGLEPAYIVHSGGKSYHPHWKANEHLPIDRTIYLRRLLCIALNSDPAVTNPHQPMRMAGFYRREKGQEQALSYWSRQRYSYEDFIGGFKAYFSFKNLHFPETISDDRWRLWKQKGNQVLSIPETELYPQLQSVQIPVISSIYTGDIPLEKCLSQANREALSGVTSDRNITGYALACDLIGCEKWLKNNGYQSDRDSHQLFLAYCLSCSSGNGWHQPEWDSIWRSALSSNPTPARGDEGLNKFIHWYRWENDPEYRQAAIAQWKKDNNKQISKEEWNLKFGLKPLLQKIGRNLERNKQQTKKRLSAWGFSQEQIKGYERALTQPVYYQSSHRLDTWYSSGKWTFDASGTGTGKSFDAGRIDLSQFDCNRAFYITSDPRNPTTDTLADWGYLSGRHGGLTKDAWGKLRVAKAKDKITVPANCGRTKTIAALKQAAVDSADSADLVCRGCNWYEACKGGYLFGYLGSRQKALKHKLLRTHPLSLPHPEQFEEYQDSLLVWDEWESILTHTKQIKVSSQDIGKLTTRLLTDAPDLLLRLQPLLTALSRLFSTRPPTRFGWNHRALLAELPSLPDSLDLAEISSLTQVDLGILNPTAEYGEDIDNLPATVRKRFNNSDRETARIIEQKTIKQWLVPFLAILQGRVGYLSLAKGILTVTVPDSYLVDIAHSTRKNIFLDATGNVEELALLLGIAVKDIDYMEVKPKSSTLIKYIQVAGMGRLGQQRGNHQQWQVEAVISQLTKDNPNTGIIRFKKFATGKDLRWFIESRGINDGSDFDTLIFDGIPCPNLASLAAQFTCLYGRQPESGTNKVKYPLRLSNTLPTNIQPHFEMEVSSDREFEQFVRHRILANLHQGWGRGRANRRQSPLTVYILGDYPLDVPVELVKAIDITPEAASKLEKLEMALKGAVARLEKEGGKITQQAIAQVTGYSQGYISRFRQLLQTLINSFNSKSNNSHSPPDEVQWMARKYLPLATVEDLASEIFNFSEVFDLWDWLKLWELAPARVQISLLERLILALPERDLQQLAISLQSG